MSQSKSVSLYTSVNKVEIDHDWIEKVILKLAAEFKIRVAWDKNTAAITGFMALAGALIGAYTGEGGKLRSAIGAGVGTAAGLAVSTIVSLHEIWDDIKERVKALLFIVADFLREVDPRDYVRAFNTVMECAKSRQKIVLIIVEFLKEKLETAVYSSFTTALNGL